jgi:hypothetical protein
MGEFEKYRYTGLNNLQGCMWIGLSCLRSKSECGEVEGCVREGEGKEGERRESCWVGSDGRAGGWEMIQSV